MPPPSNIPHPRLVRTEKFCSTPGASPSMPITRTLAPLWLSHALSKSILRPCRASIVMGWTFTTGHRRPLTSSGCLILVLCLHWNWPFGLTLTVLNTPGLLTSHVGLSKSQRNLEWLRGGLPPTGLGNFQGPSPLRSTPRSCLQLLLQTRII